MKSNTVLQVHNIGKCYTNYKHEWKRIVSWFGVKIKKKEEHWTLRNISFSIERGQSVGVVGKNGAGKSTLLKLITGTSRPNEGYVNTRGKIAAILELGMGFNPDLTGRENAYHSSGIMGYTKEQVDNVISDIASFADIGEYFDQPVRIYSSGMQARVAFSIATAYRPDILIVDEVLSVGDLSFQAKCMMRMDKYVQDGTSLFFVSHSLGQVRQLCSKALFISDGKMVDFGDAGRICDLYQNSLIKMHHDEVPEHKIETKKVHKEEYIVDPDLRKYSIDDVAGSLDLEFTSFKILNANMREVKVVNGEELLNFKIGVKANKDTTSKVAVGFLFCDKTGYPILSCNSNYYDTYIPIMKKDEHVSLNWKIKIPFMTGEYRIDIGMKPDIFDNVFYDRVFCAGELTVLPHDELVKQNFGGIMYVNADIKII